MAFNLRVAFTGLCAFVPNEDDNAEVRMCVVLPDATTNVPRAGADNSSLKRHRGFIQLKVAQIAGAPRCMKGSEADVIAYLNRHRITFNCVPAKSGRGLSGSRRALPALAKDTDKIADLGRMIPDFGAPDPAIVGAAPPGTVLAQVLLHTGQLMPNREEERVGRWVFQRSIAVPAFEGELTSEVVWEVPDLKKLELIAASFDGGETATWELKADEGETVEIVIANLCDENPLRWEVPRVRIVPDEDFRWYYTLLSGPRQLDLLRRLDGLTFPIPVPSISIPNGLGRNCVPATTEAIRYNLDPQLPGRAPARAPALALKGRELPGSVIEEIVEYPFTIGGSSRVERGREYLAQIGLAPGLRTFSSQSRDDFQGEIEFRIKNVHGTFTEIELTRLGFTSAGMKTEDGFTGRISVSGTGRGSLVRTGDRRWSLEAQVDARVLYRALEKERAFTPLARGLYMPELETFRGMVRAELEDPDGDGELTATTGSFDLRWVSGGLGWIERLSIPFRNITVANISTWSARTAAMAAPGAASQGCPGTRRLKLQPYAFHEGNPDDHSGTSWERQLEVARKIWGGCCIQLDAEELILLERTDLRRSSDINAIWGSVDESDKQPDLIEVLLVDNILDADGGGATFSATTALARVVISNDNAGNPNLLAHELGHVFGGLHPEDPEQLGFWRGEHGTVLDPSGSSHQPNPDRNTPENCRRILNVALIKTGETCCISA
jgi:hypothetical protein